MSAGLVLGERYRLVTQLSEGGFGSVWRGHDTRLARDVAVKLLHAGVDVPRFKREAHALAQLSHPNIVAAYDFGIDGAAAYLVLELITGRTVAEELAAARTAGQVGLRLDRVLQMADQILAGLGAAHSAGLIHRDLKPANIMAVAGGPEIKIVDFGIARSSDASRMTAVGSVLGTLPYMAPEQFDDGPLDGRVDLYSLGCVLHELLTGVSAYQAKNTAAWIKAHHMQSPGHVRDRRPEIPAAVDTFVQLLLTKDPAGRPANAAAARAIATALPRTAAAAVPLGSAASPPGTLAPIGPPRVGQARVDMAGGKAIVCRKCGHASPVGTQFCPRAGCGDYLGWASQKLTSSPPMPIPGPHTQKSAASIRLSGSDLVTAPGAMVSTTATVHNGGSQIEEFTLTVAGAAAAWATVEPATLRIYPGDQTECVVSFAPPRHSSAPAGTTPFTVSALSSVHRSLVASANGTLQVGTFHELRATLVPAQTRGRGRTRHTVGLTNDGNANEAITLTAADRTATVRFGLPSAEVWVSPGAIAIDMSVTPPRRLLGRPRQYPFQVTVVPANRPIPAAGQVTPSTGIPAPVRLDGMRESLPLIPGWVPKLAATIVALLLAGVAAMAATHTGPFRTNPAAGSTASTGQNLTTTQSTPPPSSPSPSTSSPPSHAYPSDYANEILLAWTARDRSYLALLTDDSIADQILGWGNINTNWTRINSDGAGHAYYNKGGDYIVIRTDDQMTSAQQWHAGSIDTWDQMSFPTDPTAYAKKLISGWTTGNIPRMNLLGSTALTNQLTSMTPPSSDYTATYQPSGGDNGGGGGGGPDLVDIQDTSTGTDIAFVINTANLGRHNAITDLQLNPDSSPSPSGP